MKTYELKNTVISEKPFELIGDNYKLKISTKKRYNGNLETYASCCKSSGGFETFTMYSDYLQRICIKDCKRVTMKQVKALHEQALELLSDIELNAIEHYKEKLKKQISELQSYIYREEQCNNTYAISGALDIDQAALKDLKNQLTKLSTKG